MSGTTVNYNAAGSCVIDANQAGNAKYSAAPQVQRRSRSTDPQSISLTAPARHRGRLGTLSATGGGSGNPVIFSVDPASGAGVCTVSGTTVNYTAAGSCVIDANQAGNASYAAAPQVQRRSRSPIPQSISFTAPRGGGVASATLSATGGGSGNPVVFSVDPASGRAATCPDTTVTYTAVGTCVIDADQAGNANYAAAPQVQQTVIVVDIPRNSGVSSSR